MHAIFSEFTLSILNKDMCIQCKKVTEPIDVTFFFFWGPENDARTFVFIMLIVSPFPEKEGMNVCVDNDVCKFIKFNLLFIY